VKILRPMVKDENSIKMLRDQLISFLQEEHAHASLETALKDLPEKLFGIKPRDLPYTIWQLTEHIRITQWDIVEFSEKDGKHISPEWPSGYWPKEKAPADLKQWKGTLKAIKKDRERMVELIADPQNDLYKPFTFGQGQTLLREALLIVDHTSYHTGEIIVLRRILNAWD
jgi:hypothetical protein